MIFNVSGDRLINNAELRFAKVLYSDGYYELMGYVEYDIRDFIHSKNISDMTITANRNELIDELKSGLMDIFCKLQNAERRIFRKHKVDVRGKLNYKNFNHR